MRTKRTNKMKFDLKNLDLSDESICPLCSKKNKYCSCNDNHYCPCNIKAINCKWPSDSCLCYECLELFKNCKCKLKEE